MQNKSLLIIGGTGFFGKSILKYFSKNDYLRKYFKKIFILSRKKINIIKKEKKKFNIIKINSNILTIKKLPRADHVIYAAILKNYDQDHKAVKNYLNLAKKYHLKSKILYVSSGAIYGKQPNSIRGFKENYLQFNKKINFQSGYKKEYSKIKLKNEELFKKFGEKGTKVSIARCFSFVGEHLPKNSYYAVGNFIKSILNNKNIEIKANYKVIRSYMFEDNLVKWLLKILDNSSQDCPIYNVGSDNAISINQLSYLLSKKYNLKVNLKHKNFKQTIDKYIPNIQKARKELNLSNNLSSLSAITKTIDIIKKNYEKVH